MSSTPLVVIRSAGWSYPVFAGERLAAAIPAIIDESCRGGRRFAVVSRAVQKAQPALVAKATGGMEVIPFDDGEELKTLETAQTLVEHLLQRGVRRDSVLVAIGGGMTGDTAGMAAALVLRGIDLVQVPTTLLAQVDSSLGGKVGVNSRHGKNLIGAIWPPRAVISDPAFLTSLPADEIRSGLFEAMKAGIIADGVLFELCRDFADGSEEELNEIIRRSIDVKARIVSDDEREGDRRRLLNYGHTIGHGIEAAMNYRGITHGDAVAFGMIGANAVASGRGTLDRESETAIRDAIRKRRPRRPQQLDEARVLEAIESDKKFSQDKRVMVLPRGIGDCSIVEGISREEIALGVRAALDELG
ncbi:MAG TPA: 3-dehydroquinate synthase [Thermoanaerobaculia bacterium]|nr:3-dehydroquinate synthase [Thermoanaerobaculia bacterium]